MREFDVVVLGTGAAGLTAAITAAEGGASVAVIEKADKVGGTSAWSGGQVWIPNNPAMKALGKDDSREDAITYIMSMSNGLIEQEMAEAFVDGGLEMVDFIENHSPVKFQCVPDFPDYHPEQPGGKPGGGRTLECPPFPFGDLGDWSDKVTVSPFWPNYHITVGETTLCQAFPQDLPEEEKQRRKDNDERGLGLSLIARLLRGCLDRGIEPMIETAAKELIVEEGAVAGVVVEGPNGREELRAPNVVLATGGFDWNEDFKTAFLRGPLQDSVAVPTNTGDGLKMAMKAGAMLGNMREAWWMPMVQGPFNSAGKILFTGERTLPGSIMVNRFGKRFTNEAANYNAFGAAFHEQEVNSCSYMNLPAWVLFNQKFYNKYGFGGGRGIGATEEQERETEQDWLIGADTLEGLAGKLGIPADALVATVERWNANVAQGHDPDFHRGESQYDRWWGDPNCKGTPQATLGPIEGGPYYAVEVKSGAIGTKGGPKTDTLGRVLDLDRQPIPGLYAAGNVMSSPFGMTYGGGGGTLGPGMVFGYLSGKHAAARLTNR